MEGINFKGQGFTDPSLMIGIQDDGILIRADCGRNSEVWAEVTISGEQLGELFSRYLCHQEEVPPMMLGALEAMIEMLRK